MEFENASTKNQQIKKTDKSIVTEEEMKDDDEKINNYFNNFNVQTENLVKKDMLRYDSVGEVYKVINEKRIINYAAKIIHSHPSQLTKRILNSEFQIHPKLYHPTINKLTGFCQNNTLDQMIELKRKGKLNNVLTSSHWLLLMYGIARGIRHLHKLKILHRDINPSNIFLDTDFTPHIIDFGFSKLTDDKMEKYPVGTPLYMAPEIWTSSEYSFKTDIYALGLVFFLLNELSIEYQFDDNNNRNQICFNNSSLKLRTNLDESIPDACKELIERCLDVEPSKRPSSSQIVEELTTNHGFINDEELFHSYVELINEKEKCYDTTLFKNKTISNEKIESINSKYQSIVQQDEREEEEKLNNKLKCLKVNKIDFNEFKKKGSIDSGGYGKVFLIKHNKTEKLYAAKRMDKKQRSDFVQELKILSETNHPFIVKLIGYSLIDFQQNPCLIIVMEYMKNGSLENFISNKVNLISNEQWNDTMKLINIYGIASVMKYLHSLDFLHCDLKPSNILISELGLPIICDFGLSLILKLDQTTHDGFRGTAEFCSPEMFEQGISSKKSDVYSFGMVVYEIITNIHPFENLNFREVCYQIITNKSRPAFNNTVPDRYKKLIVKCWDENPENRPSFEQIEHELRTDDSFIIDKINKDLFHSFIEILNEREQGNDVTDKLYNIFPIFKNLQSDISYESDSESSKDMSSSLNSGSYCSSTSLSIK